MTRILRYAVRHQPVMDLAHAFSIQFPHLIIHIDSAKPDKSYGNFMNGTMTSTISSMYNFDVPSSAAGKTCTLEFMFPTYDQLETSSYAISGDGKAEFYTLTKPAAKDDTFNHSPASDKYLGEYSLTPGSASTVGSMACPAGQTVGIWMVSATGSSLNYFQDSNPCRKSLHLTAQFGEPHADSLFHSNRPVHECCVSAHGHRKIQRLQGESTRGDGFCAKSRGDPVRKALALERRFGVSVIACE